MEKKTYIATLFRFPAFKKSQHEQSENDGHVIITGKEKHKNRSYSVIRRTRL